MKLVLTVFAALTGVWMPAAAAADGSAADECVIYEVATGTGGDGVSATGGVFAVGGRWDLSRFGEIVVDFAEPVQPCGRIAFSIRMENEGAVPPDSRANGCRGCYEITVMPTNAMARCVRPIPPRMPEFEACAERMTGVRLNGLFQLVWPSLYWGRQGLPWGDRILGWTLDASKVTKVLVIGKQAYTEVGQAIATPKVTRIAFRGRVPALRTVPGFAKIPPEKFFPFIDRFGQFKWREWPGIVHSEAELRTMTEAEDRELAAHPKPACQDKWGGWKDGPRFEATGSFRVKKVDGKWWFVDPDGYLWWSFGPVRVSASCGMTSVEESRRGFFEELPAADSPFAAFYRTRDELLWPYYVKWGVTNTYDFTSANLYRKYGADWEREWAERSSRRLRSWGANTIANSSDMRVKRVRKVPYCERFELKSRSIQGTEKLCGWWPFRDPFDPSFRENLRVQLEAHRDQLDDPWCFGFFIDNELIWGREPDLARWTWESPDDQPAKIEFRRRLRAKYGRVGDELPAEADLKEFSYAIINAYFSIVREEFKKAAPGKLYMGCRFSGSDPYVIREAEKYVDVVSFNCYKASLRGAGLLPEDIDKPYVIGEFHFGALDRSPFMSGLRQCADQRARAEAMKDYVLSGLEDPRCAGVHWHQWADDVATGRFDGENFQIGWVDICDNPYPETVQVIRWLGDNLYPVRHGFTLVSDGVPAATIVRAGDVASSVAFFQQEAAKCLKGRRFTEADVRPATGRAIVFEVRKTSAAEEDAYEIAFPDENTMKIVCTAESARFALAYILRTAFGVRWLFQGTKEVFGEELNEYPETTTAVLARKTVRQGPMPYWLLREVGWQDITFKQHAWENKGQRLTHGIMLDVIPVHKYAEKGTFPEVYWSVQTPGGKRVPPARAKGPLSDNPYLALRGYDGDWNPCFSDPAAVEVATADVLERLTRNPRQRIVNIEICDNGHMCRCDRCREIVGDRRNSMGFPDYGRTYWPFVSKVAAAVGKKRPDVFFSALGYREVNDPPAEALPGNVFVRLCFEHTAMIDPEVAVVRRRVLSDWAAKCAQLEFYDYNHGTLAYLLPRVYFSVHADLLREFHDRYHACGYYSELSSSIPFEGPKAAILSCLIADPTADPRALLREWCVDAVGVAAAEPLADYWRFWEDYSTGARIRETSWFRQSRFNIYQSFAQVSQTYGLRRGDMARQRARMDEVVARASTPGQRKRAAAMMEMHLLAEDAAKAVFAEFLEPDGSVPDASTAAELLDALPEALASARRWNGSRFSKHFCKIVDTGLRTGLGAVTPFAADGRIRARLRKYADDPALPADIRGLMRVSLGETGANLIANGSFEEAAPLPACWRGGTAIGRRVETVASDGRFAFGGRNPMLEYKLPVEPGKTYIVLMDVFADAGSAEGRFSYVLSPYAGGTPRTHQYYSDLTLPAGRWQTLTGVFTAGRRANGTPDSELYVNIYAKKYEENEHVYLDNVRVYLADY